MSEDFQKRSARYYSNFVAREVLLPFLLVILGIVIFDPVKEWWLGPKSYKVYLVGASSPEIDKIFRGVRLGGTVEPLQVDDVPISLETVDDLGDAAATAKYIAEKEDALLVIGHVYSQRTIDALPTYMGVSPPIPLIATKETSQNLLSADMQVSCAKRQLGCPILQLSPTNETQARDALQFALTQVKRKRGLLGPLDSYHFLILKQANGTNAGYVDSLTDTYEGLLQGEFSKERVFHSGTINLGDAGTFSNITSGLASLKPDVIVYVGQSPLARQFFSFFRDQVSVQQPASSAGAVAHASKYEFPLTLLCDAAVSPDMASKGFMDIPQVFAMYPISFSDYSQSDSVLGRDAFTVISSLVKEAGLHRPLSFAGGWSYEIRRILRMHRVDDARTALASAFQDTFKSGRTFTGPTGNEYAFEFPYRRKNGRYHVWAITSKGIIEADRKDGDPIYTAQTRPKHQPLSSHKQDVYAVRADLSGLHSQ